MIFIAIQGYTAQIARFAIWSFFVKELGSVSGFTIPNRSVATRRFTQLSAQPRSLKMLFIESFMNLLGLKVYLKGGRLCKYT